MSQLIKLLCFLALSMTSNSGADIVVLSSGERLDVSIIETTLDSVHVTHPILGELHIATKDITSIETTATLQSAGPAATKAEAELPQVVKNHLGTKSSNSEVGINRVKQTILI